MWRSYKTSSASLTSDHINNYQKGRVGIPLTGLTPTHFCPKRGPGFPASYLGGFSVS